MSVSLFAAALPAFSGSSNDHAAANAPSPVMFAFTGGGYDGYETWAWESITHLGFWTPPSADVRTLAEKNGVKLFHTCGTPDRSNWTNVDARKAVVQACVADVETNRYDGVFFDFEGNKLSAAEKAAYTQLAQEATAALAPLNATLAVCVGGRPTYELRNYDYTGLAAAADFLFIMGYDLHLWDDYTCTSTSEGNVCSPAEASIRSITAGVNEYLQLPVAADKLVLGLPWYGQKYREVLAPINDGQIDYKDVLRAFDWGIVTKKVKDQDSLSWKIDCSSGCKDRGSGLGISSVWYDDAETLRPKFALAGQKALRGVGMWRVDSLPVPAADGSDPHAAEREAMWAAIKAWQNVSSDASSSWDAQSMLI